MYTMIFISSVALLVGIVGSFVIWRMDARRAKEIEHPNASARRALGAPEASGAPSLAAAAPGVGPRHATSRHDLRL